MDWAQHSVCIQKSLHVADAYVSTSSSAFVPHSSTTWLDPLIIQHIVESRANTDSADNSLTTLRRPYEASQYHIAHGPRLYLLHNPMHALLTLWRPLFPYGTAIKHSVPGRVKPSFVIFLHPGTLTLRIERQSARMSKITNDGLTRPGTGCFIAVSTWQQWASKD